MFMKKIILILVAFLTIIDAAAQSKITFTVFNDNFELLTNASVYSANGNIVAVSDWRGEFVCSAKAGDKLTIKHVAYHEMDYEVTKDDVSKKKAEIRMFMKFFNLPQATIIANVPHIAYNNKVVSIADFEINDMGIYILAHRIRNYSLLHLSFDFDTIAEINLPRKFDRLYKDVYNQIHVMSKDSVYWVGTLKRGDEAVGMALSMGVRKEQFDYIHGHVSAATDKVIITHRYTNGNQELYYFNIDGCDGRVDTTLLEHIRWEEGCDLMTNIRMFGPMGLKGEAQSLFVKPIYDPVFNMNNEIFVFNFEENIINMYDSCAQKINSFPLSFHKCKSWGNKIRLVEGWNKKVLMDARNNAFYAVFLSDGITTLKKIDILTGSACTTAVFGGFPYIDKLKIHNGKAYFLFKDDSSRNSRLYEVAIE